MTASKPGPSLRMAIAAALLVVVRPGAAAFGTPTGVAPVPGFDPVTFFTGATDSVGSLKQVFSSAKASHVTGFGAFRSNGLFVLDQSVMIAGEPTRSRQWQLHQISPSQFGGTVSDGSSPVTISVSGNRLVIRYAMQGGLGLTSILTIAPDGRRGHIESRIKKWGITVATLSETIRKN
jgi:hypothetical protein